LGQYLVRLLYKKQLKVTLDGNSKENIMLPHSAKRVLSIAIPAIGEAYLQNLLGVVDTFKKGFQTKGSLLLC
jgi:hypothetical protein